MITLNPPTSLNGAHRRTYEAIFRHPAAHNLAWREVQNLFRHLGDVAEEPNGNLKVMLHGQTMVLRPAHTKDVAEISELMALRHFLQRASAPAVPAPTAPESAARPRDRWLLVIDHHQARLFRSQAPGSIATVIVPQPRGDDHRPSRGGQAPDRGREKSDAGHFFGAVAEALHGAGKILVFGCGNGKGSEMEQFIAWLKEHHPELARRLAGSMTVDEHHLTDAQLLARARDYFD